MTSILVDSDILIEVTRARDAGIISRWIELSSSDVAILYSPVSVAELWAGARPGEYDNLSHLFRALTCAPIDEKVGQQAGAYMRQFSKSHAVEIADALIAASAVQHRAELWTRNRKHYPMKDLAFFD